MAELSDEVCWQAVCERDASMNSRFVYGVRTTGIFCRPSCPARRPKRENVVFLANAKDARASGLRACLRCSPESPRKDELAVAAIIQAASDFSVPVSITDLARRLDYSGHHLQKLFKRATGMSLTDYLRALRRERALAALSTSDRVTEAVYEADYAAPSRFYADNAGRLGMKPSVWLKGGSGVTIQWHLAATTLGPLLVAATEKGVCRVSFNEGPEHLTARFPGATITQGGADFAALFAEVVKAIEGQASPANIPLDVQGTAFQEEVWNALKRIPVGETRSYAEIAAAVGRPNAVRATGSANGANPVAVLVPCHRVVRSDGTLGGYAYGFEIKQTLLDRERHQSRFPSIANTTTTSR